MTGLSLEQVGLPRWCSGKKKSACHSGDATGAAGLSPGSGRSPGEGDSNPLQYSCLENPIDRRAWRATVYEVTNELDTVQFSSVTQSCLTLYEPMDCNTAGLPALHYLLEFAQAHVH